MKQEMKQKIRQMLVDSLGTDRVLAEPVDLLPYNKDTYNVKFSEQGKLAPDFVVLPETTEEVQEIVKIARDHKIPLLPKGGGSGRTGMLVPIYGGIIVDTIRMNKIIEVSIPNLAVTVQPGITLNDLDSYLSKYGLSLHQEQGSYKVATVGGSIATSGFSRKHQKYGTIADRVMSLEVVLADGSVLRTGKKVLYTSTGYRLHQLFIGAEGTLGIITEATLRVEPLPEERDAVLAFYDDFWVANEAAQRLMQSSVTFTGAEAYEVADSTKYGAPPNKKGIFYACLEGTKGEVEAEHKYISNIVADTGGIAAKPEDAKKFLDVYVKQFCGARATTGFEDALVAYVPMEHIKEYYDELWGRIMPKYGLEGVPGEKLSLDAGRYRMLGARFFIEKSDEGWERYRKALREIATLTTSFGGSISSCHGVGIEHKDNLDLEFSEIALDVMRSIKKALDPLNIMNPGKKIPEK